MVNKRQLSRDDEKMNQEGSIARVDRFSTINPRTRSPNKVAYLCIVWRSLISLSWSWPTCRRLPSHLFFCYLRKTRWNKIGRLQKDLAETTSCPRQRSHDTTPLAVLSMINARIKWRKNWFTWILSYHAWDRRWCKDKFPSRCPLGKPCRRWHEDLSNFPFPETCQRRKAKSTPNA